MAGVWRVLGDVGKTLSGVLGVGAGEAPEEQPRPADAPQDVPPQDVPAGDVPAGDVPAEHVSPGDVPPEPAAESPEPPAEAPLPQTGEQGAAVAAPVPAPADEEPAVPATLDAADPVAPPPSGVADPDPVLAAAVDLAREAAAEVAGRALGEHLGVEVEPSGVEGPVLTHAFATTDPAYVGWRWAVTVARAEGDEHVTVDEVVLLPGAGALLAPAWVPWSERVQPGDLSPGDLLPPSADDPRLVPAYADPDTDPSGAALADAVRWELGLGRPRVLSREGRAEAAERWESGEAGPDAPIARQAPGRCADCGFLVLLAGSLRNAFGVCANGSAPDDGKVVALSHGCGAHSETVVELQHQASAGMAVEDDEFELVPVAQLPDPEPEGA